MNSIDRREKCPIGDDDKQEQEKTGPNGPNGVPTPGTPESQQCGGQQNDQCHMKRKIPQKLEAAAVVGMRELYS